MECSQYKERYHQCCQLVLDLFFKINPLFGHAICVNDHFTIIIIRCIYIMLINIYLVFFGLYIYNLHGYCCIVLLILLLYIIPLIIIHFNYCTSIQL